MEAAEAAFEAAAAAEAAFEAVAAAASEPRAAAAASQPAAASQWVALASPPMHAVPFHAAFAGTLQVVPVQAVRWKAPVDLRSFQVLAQLTGTCKLRYALQLKEAASAELAAAKAACGEKAVRAPRLRERNVKKRKIVAEILASWSDGDANGISEDVGKTAQLLASLGPSWVDAEDDEDEVSGDDDEDVRSVAQAITTMRQQQLPPQQRAVYGRERLQRPPPIVRNTLGYTSRLRIAEEMHDYPFPVLISPKRLTDSCGDGDGRKHALTARQQSLQKSLVRSARVTASYA